MSAWRKYKGLIHLTLLLVVAPTITYRMAIGDTVRMWRAYKQERALITAIQQRDTTQVFTVESSEQIRSGRLLDMLLPVVEANRAAIEKYTPIISEQGSGIELHTVEIALGGGFIPIVRIVDSLENSNNGCKLVSVNMKSYIQRQTKKRQLSTTIIVQQITQTE